jgi:hypothetical protein
MVNVSGAALVFAFHDNTLYTFERADRLTASCFGGPSPKITGRTFCPKPLHCIASLGQLHIPVLAQHHVVELPLMYGMCYDGCLLSYRLESGYRIELLEIDPASSADDWPYPNFPPLIPYEPLRLDDSPRRVSYDEFAASFPNMPEKQSAEMIVAVPPPATIGLSFWDVGDWDGVTIVFECDLQKRQMRAFNATM